MPADRLQRQGNPAPIGIVHLGPGAFFRAFNAVYTHEAMAQAGGDWGILAVSLKSPTARDQLAPQGGAYTSVTLTENGPQTEVITAISEVLVAPEDPAAVVAAIAARGVKILSLTVTEKGYCHAPSTGALDASHPDITHDLAQPDRPRSAVGFIVAGLRARMQTGAGGLTVLSCDNLPANGPLLRGITLDFARRLDPALADWIAAHASFPATMVDRITPATAGDTVQMLQDRCGYHDPACVAHESFRQWVIEDDFKAARPAWDLAGAQFTQAVAAHELMKLRCLNGTHSTLAYLGYLAGYQTIADCVADPAYAALCNRLWQDDIIPVTPQPEGEDLPAYCASLLARYQDRAIRHRTWQIAMDGSQKLPQRILGTIRDNLAKGHLPAGLCLAVAGWMRYVGGTDDAGQPIDVRDPLADRLAALGTSADPVAALLGLAEVFGTDLPQDDRFRAAVTAAYARLANQGARATVQDLTAI